MELDKDNIGESLENHLEEKKVAKNGEDTILKDTFFLIREDFKYKPKYIADIILLTTALCEYTEIYMTKVCEMENEHQDLWSDIYGNYLIMIEDGININNESGSEMNISKSLISEKMSSKVELIKISANSKNEQSSEINDMNRKGSKRSYKSVNKNEVRESQLEKKPKTESSMQLDALREQYIDVVDEKKKIEELNREYLLKINDLEAKVAKLEETNDKLKQQAKTESRSDNKFEDVMKGCQMTIQKQEEEIRTLNRKLDDSIKENNEIKKQMKEHNDISLQELNEQIELYKKESEQSALLQKENDNLKEAFKSHLKDIEQIITLKKENADLKERMEGTFKENDELSSLKKANDELRDIIKRNQHDLKEIDLLKKENAILKENNKEDNDKKQISQLKNENNELRKIIEGNLKEIERERNELDNYMQLIDQFQTPLQSKQSVRQVSINKVNISPLLKMPYSIKIQSNFTIQKVIIKKPSPEQEPKIITEDIKEKEDEDISQLQRYNDIMKEMTQRNSELNDDLEAKINEIQQLNKDLLEKTDEINECKTNLQLKEKELYSLKTEQETQIREITILKDDQKGKDKEIQKLKDDLFEKVEEINQLEENQDEKTKQINQLKQDQQETINNFNKFKQEQISIIKDIHKENEINISKGDLDHENKTVTKKLDLLVYEIKELKEVNNNLTITLEARNKEIRALKEEKAQNTPKKITPVIIPKAKEAPIIIRNPINNNNNNPQINSEIAKKNIYIKQIENELNITKVILEKKSFDIVALSNKNTHLLNQLKEKEIELNQIIADRQFETDQSPQQHRLLTSPKTNYEKIQNDPRLSELSALKSILNNYNPSTQLSAKDKLSSLMFLVTKHESALNNQNQNYNQIKTELESSNKSITSLNNLLMKYFSIFKFNPSTNLSSTEEYFKQINVHINNSQNVLSENTKLNTLTKSLTSRLNKSQIQQSKFKEELELKMKEEFDVKDKEIIAMKSENLMLKQMMIEMKNRETSEFNIISSSLNELVSHFKQMKIDTKKEESNNGITNSNINQHVHMANKSIHETMK